MLTEAHVGILFRAPDNVKEKFPQFKAVETYGELMELVKGAMVDPLLTKQPHHDSALLGKFRDDSKTRLEFLTHHPAIQRPGVARR